jgi:integrase
MGTKIKQLTERGVAAAKEPGYFSDGAGLYLQISKTGSKSWLFKFTLHGKSREMGLGSTLVVGLKAARDAAADARKLVQAGIDPIEDKRRKAAEEQQALEAKKAAKQADKLTLDRALRDYVQAHEREWTPDHAHDWRGSVISFISEKTRARPIASIVKSDIVDELGHAWNENTITAARVLNRLAKLFSAAIAAGHHPGPNPASWKDNLEHVFASPKKIHVVESFAAIDFVKMPLFLASLRETDDVWAHAVEFAILTAGRSTEVREATWTEIDLERGVWSLPANRMKKRRPHAVPLSAAALDLLRKRRQLTIGDGYVFTGLKPGSVVDGDACLDRVKSVCAQIGVPAATLHGMRSAFSDWAHEETSSPEIVIEMALAHMTGNATSRAYRRGDLIEKRRALMESWASYCTAKPADNVVPLRREA